MEQYKASIQGVDDALARLTATLASYKVNGSKSEFQTQKLVQQRNERSPEAAVFEPRDRDRDIVRYRVYKLTSKVTGSAVSWKEWNDNWEKGFASHYVQIKNKDLRECLLAHRLLHQVMEAHPYCFLVYLEIADVYLRMGYPDLASGASYKSMLLIDAIRDDSDEYHELAYEAFKRIIERIPADTRFSAMKLILETSPERNLTEADMLKPTEPLVEADEHELRTWIENFYQRAIYKVLIRSIMLCGDLRSAGIHMSGAFPVYQYDDSFVALRRELIDLVKQHYGEDYSSDIPPASWPSIGKVRREVYPWNIYEPDRFHEIDNINDMMDDVAPKLEVKAVELPLLTGGDGSATSKQLGVFAKEDIMPGETVLVEPSMLTVNNKLQDVLCDACSSELPGLSEGGANDTVACEDCDVVFCSQRCLDLATGRYHPAVCEMDTEQILRDPDPKESAQSLYGLLLLRSFALAETQDCHPLRLDELKYIWGDFSFPEFDKIKLPNSADPDTAFSGQPRTLHYEFEYNVRTPLHMLEKMDIDIFRNHRYDIWVFNTLYAKFRGTASARLSGAGGTVARGPDVCAVHPMWCMANHSCDPNVSWEWDASIKLSARNTRATWTGSHGEKKTVHEPGIRKGEEVLNHYCDLDLPVNERRDWASGALGGDCMCERCIWEAEQQEQSSE